MLEFASNSKVFDGFEEPQFQTWRRRMSGSGARVFVPLFYVIC
jgi:hypothetical protein